MIPWAVDASFDRRPVANWVMFGLLILAFLLQSRFTAEQIELFFSEWKILWLVGHNWLHANAILLILNLLFLWPFGNAVCAQIGNWQYLGLYIVLGLLGGVIHLLLGDKLGFGASVMVSGIAGMYLVFFPENLMNCMFFFPRPVTVGVSTYFIVAVWLIFDLLAAIFGVQAVTYLTDVFDFKGGIWLLGVQRVSYAGHILAFGGGIGLAILGLKKKWVTMERGEKSLLQLLQHKEDLTEQMPERKAQEPGRAAEEMEEPESEKAELETAKVEKPQEEFIRFYCECGKAIKVPKARAGRTGHCPRCKQLIKVPEA